MKNFVNHLGDKEKDPVIPEASQMLARNPQQIYFPTIKWGIGKGGRNIDLRGEVPGCGSLVKVLQACGPRGRRFSQIST